MDTATSTIKANPTDGALSAIVKLRIPAETEKRLNQIEAFFAGQGYRHVNRSHIVRCALDRLITELHQEHPEIADITLP